jgi:hypothetical protein
MVEDLRRWSKLLPEILDIIEQEIREPMAAFKASTPCPHIRSNGESNWCALAAEYALEPEPDAPQQEAQR